MFCDFVDLLLVDTLRGRQYFVNGSREVRDVRFEREIADLLDGLDFVNRGQRILVHAVFGGILHALGCEI